MNSVDDEMLTGVLHYNAAGFTQGSVKAENGTEHLEGYQESIKHL